MNFEKLQDIANVIDSLHKTPQYSETGYSMVRCTDVKYGFLNLQGTLKVSKDIFDEFSRRYTPSLNDIVITRVGTYGITALVQDVEFCLGQNTSVIIAKNINPKYLYVVLNSPILKYQIEASVVGSTQKTLSLKAINSLEIPRFSPKVEDRIAKIISELDDKLYLNNQINQTLESIAQAIFKSWFIDFEPVRAKIAAKQTGQDPERAAMCAISGKSEAELKQMSEDDFAELQATAALFPDELVESELGEVPRGWELQQIKDIAKYCTNKISLKDLTLENYISTENMLPEKKGIEKASSLPKANSVPAFRKGNILVSNIRPYFKKIWLSSFDGGHSNDVLNFEVIENGCEEYLYNFIYQDNFFEQMMASSKGSKMPRGDKKAIMDFQIVTSSVTLRKLYSEKVRKFYSKQNSIKIENQILINLRDALLPKLLSGEVGLMEIGF
ncbi:restriction endonuclease subunit S [Acinetobacter corruptisaponis]|uniref:Restriction endonuclease subunit S n=1 Tax=Acinetobacter corruptisaponis TaxID=3045147 RepID=A0ABY8S2S9_9GAMM|nr:restriction endonuclease subunit S [Acinetobacter sp. KCTC 92772]WHP05127.1 restriction endonuclease subunit S [Acinetobacter sp. KCTC 92772]